MELSKEIFNFPFFSKVEVREKDPVPKCGKMLFSFKAISFIHLKLIFLIDKIICSV